MAVNGDAGWYCVVLWCVSWRVFAYVCLFGMCVGMMYELCS